MKLSKTERARRARSAKKKLLPKAIAAVGRMGFGAAAKKLKGEEGIVSPEKLAGYLKAEARKRGLLSPKHK